MPADQEKGNNNVPEHPEQKAAFLPFPKAGENVSHRHDGIGMLPCVVVLKIMVEDDVKDNAYYSENRKGMYKKGRFSQALPPGFGRFVYRNEIRNAAKKRCAARKSNKKVPGFAPNKMLTYIINTFHSGVK